MKPLICFYENDHFIYSNNYVLHSCRPEMQIAEFLDSIEADFKNELKIIQINFEYNNATLFKEKIELYKSDKASVFVINQYEILSQKQLFLRVTSTLTTLIHQFNPLEKKEQFIEKIHQIKKDISTGRIYQVNLTAPLLSETSYPSEKIFKNYFEKFEGAYKALLPLPNYDLISFSPELFLKKNQQKLKTQPIKGSLSIASDFEKDLIKNSKEDAELSMIVDLLRNDLNRIEASNSAVVNLHRAPMKLGYIQHTYSEIEINTNQKLSQILEAALPGGSISGCPKIESLKVISELELYKRQAYTGILGWWKDGNFCLNITIRSFMRVQNQLFYHAGCGIVYDSEPEKEWAEFIIKTGHLNVTR